MTYEPQVDDYVIWKRPNGDWEEGWVYFKGDPVGQNIYLLPDSNFEGGLGVFYSSSSASFIVKVIENIE